MGEVPLYRRRGWHGPSLCRRRRRRCAEGGVAAAKEEGGEGEAVSQAATLVRGMLADSELNP